MPLLRKREYLSVDVEQKSGAKDETGIHHLAGLIGHSTGQGPPDGWRSVFPWMENKEITYREAILLSMIANMFCTYLENLEYVDSLRKRLISDTSVLLKQLDSGRQVKGILDKRIVAKE